MTVLVQILEMIEGTLDKIDALEAKASITVEGTISLNDLKYELGL